MVKSNKAKGYQAMPGKDFWAWYNTYDDDLEKEKRLRRQTLLEYMGREGFNGVINPLGIIGIIAERTRIRDNMYKQAYINERRQEEARMLRDTLAAERKAAEMERQYDIFLVNQLRQREAEVGDVGEYMRDAPVGNPSYTRYLKQMKMFEMARKIQTGEKRPREAEDSELEDEPGRKYYAGDPDDENEYWDI